MRRCAARFARPLSGRSAPSGAVPAASSIAPSAIHRSSNATCAPLNAAPDFGMRGLSPFSASSRSVSVASEAINLASSSSRRTTASRRARAVANWCASSTPASRAAAAALRLSALIVGTLAGLDVIEADWLQWLLFSGIAVSALLDDAFAPETDAWVLHQDGEWVRDRGRVHLQEAMIEGQRRRRYG
mgnify:CR=1 FL=1